ncbi:hypothetical protein N7532_005701 [Penicillium argentinense]|uniref:Uncharacterized protein n=1 Tax=Penicillium argentinense TaxID=1131581 RepID=A0A9W9KA70_9EURO|nr:uncharacterized protein N7532_005701 [Penicillium argentinense]KAJ5098700.1 hypothetical protein N7532_005701 [Penicillium argentinense]
MDNTDLDPLGLNPNDAAPRTTEATRRARLAARQAARLAAGESTPEQDADAALLGPPRRPSEERESFIIYENPPETQGDPDYIPLGHTYVSMPFEDQENVFGESRLTRIISSNDADNYSEASTEIDFDREEQQGDPKTAALIIPPIPVGDTARPPTNTNKGRGLNSLPDDDIFGLPPLHVGLSRSRERRRRERRARMVRQPPSSSLDTLPQQGEEEGSSSDYEGYYSPFPYDLDVDQIQDRHSSVR